MKFIFPLFLLFIFIAGCERPTDNNVNDGLPPGVPEGLRIYFAGDGDVIIDWVVSSEPDIKEYRIYRSTDSVNYSIIGISANDFFVDDSLSYDTVYFYKISVLDIYGLESSLTDPVSAKPANRSAPAHPYDVIINARNWDGKKSIVLNWSPNQESDLAGYNVYRGLSSGFKTDSTSLITFTTSAEFEDISASEFYKYYFYIIKAVDRGSLLSSSSNEVSDLIFEEPQVISPASDEQVHSFNQFIFRGVAVPASYKIIVQTNMFFGQIWEKDITSSGTYDTIKVDVPRGVFSYNVSYYWRVAAFSKSEQPNSLTPLIKFTIKP